MKWKNLLPLTFAKKNNIYRINYLGNFKILAKAKNRHKFMCELKVMAKKWKYRNMVIASKGKKIRFLILLFFLNNLFELKVMSEIMHFNSILDGIFEYILIKSLNMHVSIYTLKNIIYKMFTLGKLINTTPSI